MDDLIKRLEAWNGDDIELSIAIHRHLELSEEDFRNYVSSIKSCIALADTVLPGWDFEITHDDGISRARLWRRPLYAEGPTLPRAFLIALLRAHAAQEKRHD